MPDIKTHLLDQGRIKTSKLFGSVDFGNISFAMNRILSDMLSTYITTR
jgi:hypothetical protein